MAGHPSSSIHCQNCSFSQLCLPFNLNSKELSKLDDIIQRKRPIQKNERLFTAGDGLKALYAVRSGSFKTFTVSQDGEEQITAFHLPGEIIGFDGLLELKHQSFAQALETSMVCEIPYQTLDDLSGEFPKLRQQIMRLMSNEIHHDQEMFMLLNKRTAEERLAYFIKSLSNRFHDRGFSANEFRLTMTRGEIGNYLGLTVETISRLLTRFQKENLIEVNGKLISIVNHPKLEERMGSQRNTCSVTLQ
ncbi:fumarate/nitrate reduction transcriptional regulator Fnr [Paraneptunicella aestuarii]|uniref:fumarate/nitrate reduction transcriptional regulator Fnr n=1 Tax=Paraneptunicella aestuarii TaxID=2831148 RepID=UPI001E545561|nr:fumarate/nitrate reduction transcriptional regulator Fnr [Paraneptunicella aestuarii]UAA37112.1 fumarate/nitrate reduction transcriptional regulator Fnr [Paraneptunicella aestuarii]